MRNRLRRMAGQELGPQAMQQCSHTHPPRSPRWATHAASGSLQAQAGSRAKMHSEQLCRCTGSPSTSNFSHLALHCSICEASLSSPEPVGPDQVSLPDGPGHLKQDPGPGLSVHTASCLPAHHFHYTCDSGVGFPDQQHQPHRRTLKNANSEAPAWSCWIKGSERGVQHITGPARQATGVPAEA